MNENIKDEKKSAVKAPKTRHTYVKIDRGVDLTKVKKAQALDKNRETFWKIVFRYFKKHPLITTALVVTIAISAAASVLGPKIIENLMNVLMAPALWLRCETGWSTSKWGTLWWICLLHNLIWSSLHLRSMSRITRWFHRLDCHLYINF
jgi:hypothetical protein